MKKDRNSFFQSSNFNMSAQGGMPQNMYNPMMNYPNMSSSYSQFYQNSNMPMPMDGPNYNDSLINELESRIAKLERAINRLDARINKLEGTTYYSKETYETDGNMYMV